MSVKTCDFELLKTLFDENGKAEGSDIKIYSLLKDIVNESQITMASTSPWA